MDDIVAVRVTLTNGERRYFLTWGRVAGDPVDPGPLVALIQPNLEGFSLGGEVGDVEICDSLQEAASERYFFECLFDMSQHPIPRDERYDQWVADMRDGIRHGHDLYYLGKPKA
jgi:hypothetical protein